jgi:monofunctional biosynthetic peptidoglycan transglycosylase
MIRVIKILFWLILSMVSLFGLLFAGVGYFLMSTPHADNIKSCLTTAMYRVHLCPTDAQYIPLQKISQAVRDAVIVSEDGTFYSHHGFDWQEIRVSVEKNLKQGDYARGGSTITQQLAKNVYLTKEKSLLRKAREALLTIQIEDRLTKNEILEKYLNVVEFGPGLYGVGPAAHFYFHKEPSQLNAAEGAFLAFLLPSPKKHSVSFRKHQLTAFARRSLREIIDRLYRFKKISNDEYSQSIAAMDGLFGGTGPEDDVHGLGAGDLDDESTPDSRDDD